MSSRSHYVQTKVMWMLTGASTAQVISYLYIILTGYSILHLYNLINFVVQITNALKQQS